MRTSERRQRLAAVTLIVGSVALALTGVAAHYRFGDPNWDALAMGAVVLVSGAAALAAWGRSPKRVLGILAAGLGAATLLALSRPLPPVPIALPIGSHASAEAFARAMASEGLPLRLIVERDWFAIAVFADGEQLELVTTYRTALGGWFGGGSSRQRGLPPVSGALTVGIAGSWSAGSLPGDQPYAYVAVFGSSPASAARVEVELSDGSTELTTLRDAIFAWFRAERPRTLPEPRGTPVNLIGVHVVAVKAYDREGRLIAQQALRSP